MTKYFARLDEFNMVIDIQLLSDNVATDENAGIDYLVDHSSESNREKWKQSAKDNWIRKNGAAVGYTYDASKDAFIEPKPYPSWVLNETTCRWEAPVARPQDESGEWTKDTWDEDTTSWINNY